MQYIIILVIIAFILRFRNLRIKWRTFFKKGFSAKRGRFGVYCYCGKQGSGKTYSVVEHILTELPKGTKLYANMKTITGVDYEYINSFEDMLAIQNYDNTTNQYEPIYIFYDEIFSALTKSTRIQTDVLTFLSQMRKRQVVFITTAQEWLEINITLRRYVRYQIDCNMFNIFGVGILLKSFYDAERMKWSNEDNEYIAPLVSSTISKTVLSIANSYDTTEEVTANKRN